MKNKTTTNKQKKIELKLSEIELNTLLSFIKFAVDGHFTQSYKNKEIKPLYLKLAKALYNLETTAREDTEQAFK